MSPSAMLALACAVSQARSDWWEFQSEYFKGRLTAFTHAWAMVNGFPWECSEDEDAARDHACLVASRRLPLPV